ncbi:MAG: hypothetical protein GQ570_15150 [Helicobacteraceae bacterium]|nr:hypothetical protein [Helicobacteraceae bacterium]
MAKEKTEIALGKVVSISDSGICVTDKNKRTFVDAKIGDVLIMDKISRKVSIKCVEKDTPTVGTGEDGELEKTKVELEKAKTELGTLKTQVADLSKVVESLKAQTDNDKAGDKTEGAGDA